MCFNSSSVIQVIHSRFLLNLNDHKIFKYVLFIFNIQIIIMSVFYDGNFVTVTEELGQFEYNAKFYIIWVSKIWSSIWVSKSIFSLHIQLRIEWQVSVCIIVKIPSKLFHTTQNFNHIENDHSLDKINNTYYELSHSVKLIRLIIASYLLQCQCTITVHHLKSGKKSNNTHQRW